MTRNESLETINDLYGLETSYIEQALDTLGHAALSDQAVEWIAAKQLDEEKRKGRWLKRIAAYQSKHPHLGWNECDEYLRLGLR